MPIPAGLVLTELAEQDPDAPFVTCGDEHVTRAEMEVHANRLARVYEENASRLGMQLLHEAGVTNRDQWISDWRASDWKYLSTYYATGSLPAWRDCRISGQPLLTPMAIPPFTPQRFATRYAF